MKTVCWLYPARDVTPEEREVDWPTEPSFKAIRALLDPIFLKRPWEHVSVLIEGRRADMFVDESGHLAGLPRNEAATALYRANWMTRHPDADPESIPWIAGVAVLFERIIWT